MKKNIVFVKILLVPFIAFSLLCCNKQNSQIPVNTILWNKSLDSIKYFINGNWKLAIIQGGWSGINHINNEYWKFTSDNRLIVMANNSLKENDSCTWQKGNFLSSTTDSTQLLVLNTTQYINNPLIIYAIRNDTLALGCNCIDGDNFYLIRQ